MIRILPSQTPTLHFNWILGPALGRSSTSSLKKNLLCPSVGFDIKKRLDRKQKNPGSLSFLKGRIERSGLFLLNVAYATFNSNGGGLKEEPFLQCRAGPRSGRIPAFPDGPDHERLSPPHVSAGKN